jgi:predicted RNase H-like nuclease (RuvC/YqgF family)
MLSEEQINQLKSQNELLLLQLQDLNYMIETREEELALWRKAASNSVELQSRLDNNLYEIEQMQGHIGEQQKKLAGAASREASIETELMESLQIEKEYYEIRDQYSSTKTALADVTNQVSEAVPLYKEVADLKARIIELESNLEIASLDNEFLKEELDKYRKAASLSTAGQ